MVRMIHLGKTEMKEPSQVKRISKNVSIYYYRNAEFFTGKILIFKLGTN